MWREKRIKDKNSLVFIHLEVTYILPISTFWWWFCTFNLGIGVLEVLASLIREMWNFLKIGMFQFFLHTQTNPRHLARKCHQSKNYSWFFFISRWTSLRKLLEYESFCLWIIEWNCELSCCCNSLRGFPFPIWCKFYYFQFHFHLHISSSEWYVCIWCLSSLCIKIAHAFCQLD